MELVITTQFSQNATRKGQVVVEAPKIALWFSEKQERAVEGWTYFLTFEPNWSSHAIYHIQFFVQQPATLLDVTLFWKERPHVTFRD